MRAAAFDPSQGRFRHGAGDGEHVAQIEPFQALEIETAIRGGRSLAEFGGERSNAAERALKLCPSAEWPDIVGHDRLEPRDHCRCIRPGTGAIAIAHKIE